MGCRPLIAGWVLVLAVAVFPAFSSPEEDSIVRRWSFQVGPAVQNGTRIRVHLNPERVKSMVRVRTRGSSSAAQVPGSASGYADRDYEDGFVYTDPGTADPNSHVPGLTWYWGYEYASQYNGNSVKFHAAPGVSHSVQVLDVEAVDKSEDSPCPGVDLAGQYEFQRWGRATVGIKVGLSWFADLDLDLISRQDVAIERTIRWRHVDEYGVAYNPFPGAPYSGSYNGPGPLLTNIPDSRNTEVLSSRSRTWTAESSISASVSQLLLRAGPYVTYEPYDSLGLRLSSLFLANHVGTEVLATTVIGSGISDELSVQNGDHDREWLYGAGLELGARWNFHEVWFADMGAMATWWSDDIVIETEPFETTVSLSDYWFWVNLGRDF
jgi:hypothetical protein